MKFLGEFWDYEKSPYIREVHLRGKSCTKIENQRICMIGSGHKTESVFNNYANHIQKEIALNKIAKSTEHLFSPILKKLSSDAVYVIKDDEADEEENALKLLPEKAGA